MDSLLTSQVVAALKPSPDNTACQTNINAVLVCSLDIIVNHCDLTTECDNVADVKPYTCDPAKSAAVIAGITTSLVSKTPSSLAAFSSTLANSFAKPASAGDLTSHVASYITEKCSASITSAQSIVCPLVLTDCTNVSVIAVNQLDASASCGLSKANELLQAAGLGTRVQAKAPPSKLKSIIVTIVIFMAVGFVAALVFGFLLRRKVLFQMQLQKSALQQQQMLSALGR